MVLDAHAECVDEDAEKNSLLEDAVINADVESSSKLSKHATDSSEASRQTANQWFLFCWGYNVDIIVEVIDSFHFLLRVNSYQEYRVISKSTGCILNVVSPSARLYVEQYLYLLKSNWI